MARSSTSKKGDGGGLEGRGSQLSGKRLSFGGCPMNGGRSRSSAGGDDTLDPFY